MEKYKIIIKQINFTPELFTIISTTDINFVSKINVHNNGTKSKIVFKDLPLDDPKIRNPDISVAKDLLKWSPKIDRRVGLERTISYLNSRIA
jgi:nucleoside-diphosphate-sugar epimerase